MSDFPYPGLRPFERDETDIFFGREEHSDQLLEKLGQEHFLAVIGPSGCGKSSLVKTGLLPGLEAGFLSRSTHWCCAELRPGAEPFARLAAALLQQEKIRAAYYRYLGIERDDPGLRAKALKLLEKRLRAGDYSLHEIWAQLALPAGSRLLVLTDQFEEIFRYHRQKAGDDAPAFVALLLAAALHQDIYFCLTMRSDFIGDCALFPGLPEAINKGLYLTPRLNREQLHQAIEEPALMFDAQIEPALLNRLLNDLGGAQDQLPVLQHALMRIWHKTPDAEAKILTVRDYEEIGGLQHALAQHADAVFNGLDEARQAIAEKMFRALAELVEDNRAVRRPVTTGEIAALAGTDWRMAAELADAFRAPGVNFLTPPPDTALDADSVLDISHEALIRQWPRMRKWVETEARSAALYQRLRKDAALWKEQGRNNTYLWIGLNLENALEWHQREKPDTRWAARYARTSATDGAEEFTLAMAFLDESERHQKTSRRRRIAVLAGLFIVLCGFLLYAWLNNEQLHEASDVAQAARTQAERDRAKAQNALAEAEKQQQRALLNQSRFLADKAKQLTKQGKVFSAMRVALEALPQTSEVSTNKRPYLHEASLQLYNAVEKHWRGVLEHDNSVGQAVFSPDGKRLLTHAGNNAYLWDSRDGQILYVLKGHEEYVQHAAFSPDGKAIVTASSDNTARLWDAHSGQPLHLLKGHEDWIIHAAFSPDGKAIVTASADNTARLWDAHSGQPLHLLKGHE
ncbi:MAG: hypothetical protein GY862_00790, partial [Gammaproteobacteria bacterium]|nr:hypothetical protein [Gammaproteobacteria bacterium]